MDSSETLTVVTRAFACLARLGSHGAPVGMLDSHWGHCLYAGPSTQMLTFESISSSGPAERDAQTEAEQDLLFPPIITTQSQGKERAEPGTITQYDDKRGLQEQCFLAELSRIEQELRDKVKREQERQEALERARLEENRERWRSLCFVSLNQRVNKPWVFSFYRTFPMHIYCLPIQAPSNRNKRKKKFRR